MRYRRPSIHTALKFGLSTLALLASIALLVPSAFALFQNGNFEDGSYSGWTPATFLNYGLTTTGASFFSGGGTKIPQTTPPYNVTGANIARDTGGTQLISVMGSAGGAPLSIADPIVGAGLMVPRFGSYAIRVNSDGSASGAAGDGMNRNATTLKQQTTVTSADIDSTDSKVHVRFSFAPVLEKPAHNDSDQPYFYIAIKNLTKGNALLYENFNFAGQTGVPWVSVPVGGTTWQYTEWQLIDIAPGAGALDVGDTIEFEIIAAGCAQGGHGGYVYVDAFGAFFPSGLSVVSSAPPTVVAGTDLTYTIAYHNNDTTSYPATTVTFNTPPQTTFVSVSDTTACTIAPAVGGTGAITCDFGTVAVGGSGSFQVVVNVGVAATDKIVAGNYSIGATGFATVLGGAVKTDITTTATNAYLSGLVTNPGTLIPLFSPTWLSYQVNVANITSIDITPTLAEATASVKVNNVAPTVAGGPVTVSGLVVGDNAIPVVITAANGTTTKTYTVHVFVAPAGPVVSAPADGSSTNNKKPAISGTGYAGATVTVKEGTTVICTALVAGDGTWTCTPSADLIDGPHTFGVTQEHPVGNVSVATSHSFTVTSIVPADLEVTQTESMISLNKLKLTITVRNKGPNVVNGVVINDTFPAAPTGEVWSWTCAGTACPTASGTGNLSAANATLGSLAVDGTAVYTVTGTLKNWSEWLNTVTLVLPTGIADNTPGNNSVSMGRYKLLLMIVYR